MCSFSDQLWEFVYASNFIGRQSKEALGRVWSQHYWCDSTPTNEDSVHMEWFKIIDCFKLDARSQFICGTRYVLVAHMLSSSCQHMLSHDMRMIMDEDGIILITSIREHLYSFWPDVFLRSLLLHWTSNPSAAYHSQKLWPEHPTIMYAYCCWEPNIKFYKAIPFFTRMVVSMKVH